MVENADIKQARRDERNRCHDLFKLAEPTASASDRARWAICFDAILTSAAPDAVRAQLERAGLVAEDPTASVEPPAPTAASDSAPSSWDKVTRRLAEQQSETAE